MTRYWCERAWLGAPDGTVAHGVLLTVAGERITSITTDVGAAPADATVLCGLTTAGFANAHSHAFHRGLRGRTHAGSGSFWSWRDQMYALAERLDPDSYLHLATAAYAEMALAGFTVIGEFHYLHHGRDGVPYANGNAMGEALIEAARLAGVRFTLLDTCYLRGGVAPDGSDVPVNPVQRRFSDGTADSWAARVSQLAASPSVRVGAAIHSVRAVDPASMRHVAEWTGRRDSVLHAHVSEQPAENEQCVAAYGCTPIELLDRSGVLGARMTAVHATHLTDGDVARMAATGTACCMCPTTERDLADGIAPTAAFRDLGVDMCIGTDSHAIVDPFEETRAIELDERLASLRRGSHQPADLMRAATEVGYHRVGWDDGGRLAVGCLADFTTIGFDSPRLAGTDDASVLAAAVFAGSAADVRHVVVGGNVVVADGRHTSIDVVDQLQRTIREVWA
jgi:formiminoglutamate deiminase